MQEFTFGNDMEQLGEVSGENTAEEERKKKPEVDKSPGQPN